jgi:dCTP deaminase
MQILSDEKLRARIEGQKDPLVQPPPPPEFTDWFSKDSPVQPSSLDFHIGEIYVPGRPPDQAGKPASVADRYVLSSGQTVVIQTLEKISLPPELAGFGFPPSRISSQGILLTNPGHIDPGYEGHLHLTAINMARESFEFRKGDVIATVVIAELGATPKADFRARYGTLSPSHVTQDQLDRLAPDFANVEERAQQIAEKAVKTADISIKRAQNRAAVIGAVVTALLAIFTLYWNSQSKVDLLNQNAATMEKRFDDKLANDKRITELEQQVKDLKSQIAALSNVPARK